jgi:uncharacterized protein (DUF58 family)
MPSYLVKVRKKMSIYSKRRSRTILDGEYGSIFKGRSMDFDDLRNYVYGDDSKDIDWKATARSGQTLIRRYIAIRKHNVMLVADTGRTMSALAPGKESKRDIAVFVAGVMSYIVQKHGDLIGLVAGDSERIKRFPLKENTNHIESLLSYYNDSITTSSPASSINNVLNYILRNYRERMLLIIITDPAGMSTVDDATIKRLSVRHEQVYTIINDSTVSDPTLLKDDVYDIEDPAIIPSFIRVSKKLQSAETELTENTQNNITRRLLKYGIQCAFINSEESTINDIFNLLERQKRARRK